MKLTKIGALAAIAVLAFSACGTAGTGGDKGTIQIWSELPRQGSSQGQTDTIVAAIKYAIDEAGGKVDGWTIKYTDQDDSTAEAGAWTQERATALATEAASTNDLVAYIGTFNSGAAKIVIPVLCKAGIAMVSPANTYPGLTKPGKGDGAIEPGVYYPDGCKHNYFRVVPADDLQGDVGAAWAQELGATKVYIVDDTEIYGKGVADVFDASATASASRSSATTRPPATRRTSRPSRPRSPTPVRTSSTTAASPRTTPASSGRTSARPCPT